MDGLRAGRKGMAWNKSQTCRLRPSLTKLSHRPFLRTAEPPGRRLPSGHRGRQNPVPRRKLSIRLSAFFDETEGMRRRGPARQPDYRGHERMSSEEWGERTKMKVTGSLGGIKPAKGARGGEGHKERRGGARQADAGTQRGGA